jgi:hypothetical protein
LGNPCSRLFSQSNRRFKHCHIEFVLSLSYIGKNDVSVYKQIQELHDSGCLIASLQANPGTACYWWFIASLQAIKELQLWPLCKKAIFSNQRYVHVSFPIHSSNSKRRLQ